MSWSKGSRGYHHGNLKEALIRAALELIAEKGPAGFTFADAARWAGVSPAAPYRHFRDRDELLADVARRGFEQFAAALEAAWDGGRPDPMTAFERTRQGLSGLRAHRAVVLFGDVRSRRSARGEPRTDRGGRPRFRRDPRGVRAADRADAARTSVRRR